MLSFFINVWMKFLFLFAPFFSLTMFLSMTTGYGKDQRHKLALQVTGAVGILCFSLFFFGNIVFSLFGITLDAFRVGAGALLFLSAVGLVQTKTVPSNTLQNDDIAVVPLAMPIIVGPAVIGTLMVMGAEITDKTEKLVGCIALGAAILSIGTFLWLSSYFERMLGKKGLTILSKITGLILSALAAQLILTGIKNFLG